MATRVLALVSCAMSIGCSAPEPTDVAGTGGPANPGAQAPRPEGEAPPAKAVDEATKQALLAALTPGEVMPPPRAPEDVPGDGKPFPLTIEVVSGASGELLLYNMDGAPVDYFHPKLRGPIESAQWEQDPDHARMTIPVFVPARWEFRTSRSSGTPHYTLTCDVYEQPASGVLRIVVPQATLSGQLLDPTGAPAPETEIEVVGDITRNDALKSLGVVHVKVLASAHSGPDGRFEIPGLIPGRYLLTFDGFERAARDRWARVRAMRSVTVGDQGAVLIVDPRKQPVWPARKGGGR